MAVSIGYSSPMAPARAKLLLFTALTVGGFIVKAPLAVSRTHLTPDAVVYLNIARNIASGRGFVSTIKLHHWDDLAVVHSALRDSPPLYPLLAGGISSFAGDERALALTNLLLTCMAAGLVFLIAERLFDRRTGLLAGVAAALAPNLFRAGITSMSDPLALVLTLWAVWLVTQPKPRIVAWAGAGALTGLAVLTRYPCLVVGLAIAVAAFRSSRPWRNGVTCAAGLLPAFMYMAVATPSAQSLHYCIGWFQESLWNASASIDPLYWLHHPSRVMAGAGRNLAGYALDLVVGPRGLFLMSAGLAAWLLAYGREMRSQHKLALSIAALTALVYAATWSIPAVKGSRFLLLSYCLLLPFCAAGLLQAWGKWGLIGRRAVLVITATTFAVYVWGCVSAARYEAISDCRPLTQAEAGVIRSSLKPHAIVATNNPWEVDLSTGLPVALLPRDLDRAALEQFLHRYDIDGIVLLGAWKGTRTARETSRAYAKAGCAGRISVYSTTARTHKMAD